MKKLVLAAIFTLLFTMSASADNVSVNGSDLVFSEETGVPFINSDNRTMVPVRVVSENLGADVAWSEAEQKVTVTTENHTVELFIGSTDMIVNGQKKQMDTAVVEKNGRTYLPVRYIAEAIGCHVMWFDRRETAVVMDSDYYGKYTAFRDMFTYEGVLSDYTEVVIVTAISQGKMTLDEVKDFWSGLTEEDKKLFVSLAIMEKHEKNPQYPISTAFIFKDSDDKQYYLATASTFSYDVQLFEPFEN